MSKCLGHDISVRQHSKSEHWAPCHIQTPSRYDWKIVESDVKPKSNKQRRSDQSEWHTENCRFCYSGPCFFNQLIHIKMCLWRSQLIWICTVSTYVNLYKKIKESDWLTIRHGCGILIYSAWQGSSMCKWADWMHDGHLLSFDTFYLNQTACRCTGYSVYKS